MKHDLQKSALALFASLCLASGTANALRQMSFDNFSTASGLSSSLVNSLAQDSLGHIWVGTDFGLNRFDGGVFTSYSKTEHPALFRNDILHLACMPGGELLAASGNGFFVKYDSNTDQFSDVCPANFAETYQKSVSNLVYVPKNKGFVAGTSNGIYTYDALNRSFSSVNGLYKATEQNSIDALEVDVFGRFWMLTDDKLKVLDDNGKTVYSSVIRNNQTQAITSVFCPVSSFEMMVHALADRLSFYTIAPNGDISPSHHVPLPFRNLRGIARSKNGDYWFISDGDGLWTTSGVPTSIADFQRVIPFGTTEVMFSKLYCIFVDRTGDLWVGSQNSGLWRLRLSNSNGIFTATELGMSNCVATGFADLDGDRHLVASDGIGVFGYSSSNLTAQLYGPANGLTNKNVTSVLNDRDGRVWVTTWGGGLFSSASKPVMFSNVRFNGIASPRANLFNITQLQNGDYWVCAGGEGLYVLHGGVWSLKLLKHNNYGPDPDRWPYFVVEAGADYRWVFTSTTTWIEANGIMAPIRSHYHGDRKDQMVAINDACFIPGYGMLAATNRGLLLFSADGSSFQKLDFCPVSEYSSVLYVADGVAWTSGVEGILKIDLKNKLYAPYPFDFSSRGQNYFKTRSKIIDSNGRIYFGNRDGFFSFIPTSTGFQPKLGHVGVSRIRVNGQPLKFERTDSASAASPVAVLYQGSERGTWPQGGNGGTLNLKYGETDIDIQLDVVDFNECPNRLYYRLKGLNDAWTQLPADKNFLFSYIPSGSYTLQVASLNNSGSEENIHYALTFNVSPPWWATWWFRLLLLALVLGYIFLKYRSVVNEKKVLQEKVDERTAELKTKNLLIEKRNAELNKVLSYKDRLIAVVAHDLKNPMFAIVGALEGLLRKGTSAQECQTVVGEVLGSARTLQNEMSKLLAWATSCQDDIEYRPANTDLGKIIANDLALLKGSAERKGVKVVSEVDLINFCYADARMVSTVIRNVVNNSIKFTPEGKCVYVKAWQEGGMAKVRIADEGVGMTAEKLQELQTEGRHASTSGTAGEQGTGLGLGIVRDYVLQNNGTFAMNSQPGEGTTTTICLPLSDDALVESDLHELEKVPEFRVDTELMEGNTILVVDDDPLICQNIKKMLEGYVQVLTANNGRQAIELMQKEAVDIVVSDVEMPVMNGIDMSIELSKNPATNYIPILFLSAKSSESDRLLGLLTGAIDYIPKPFSQNELLIKLHNILSLRQKQQQRLLSEQMLQKTETAASAAEMAEKTEKAAKADDAPVAPAAVADTNTRKAEPDEMAETAGRAADKAEKINPLLQEMVNVIERNYADSSYSVERLADDMCLTKITLYRRVKSLTGQTPVELINEYRLQRAMALLKEGNSQVGDVAFQVGFSDPAYFTRRFRSLFGFPPSAVKK